MLSCLPVYGMTFQHLVSAPINVIIREERVVSYSYTAEECTNIDWPYFLSIGTVSIAELRIHDCINQSRL